MLIQDGELDVRNPSRHGGAEIRVTLRGPAKALRMNVSVLPPVFLARLGMVNNPILRLAGRLHEGAMTEAPHVFGFLKNGPAVCPGFGIQKIARCDWRAFPGNNPEIQLAARGVNDENRSIRVSTCGPSQIGIAICSQGWSGVGD